MNILKRRSFHFNTYLFPSYLSAKHTHMRVSLCKYANMYVHMFLPSLSFIYIYICVCVCVCVCACVCVIERESESEVCRCVLKYLYDGRRAPQVV